MMCRVPARGEILDMMINSRIAETNNGGSNNIGSSAHNNNSSGNEEPPIPDIEDIVPQAKGLLWIRRIIVRTSILIDQ